MNRHSVPEIMRRSAGSKQPDAMFAMTRRSAGSTLPGATGAVKELNIDMTFQARAATPTTVGHRRVGAVRILRVALQAALEARAANMEADAIVEAATGMHPREATAAPAAGAAVKNSKQSSRSRRCSSAGKAAIVQIVWIEAQVPRRHRVLFSK